MIRIIFSLGCLLVSLTSIAQKEESVEPDGTKIIKGFFTKQQLSTDAAFPWYLENKKGFIPDSNAVKSFTVNKSYVYILAFGGTWCGDTKTLLPKFYALTEASNFPEDHITLIGVDRSKKTIHNLSETFNVTNVPTFIVFKNGKEIGRVVEYGKYGMIDKELGEILQVKQ